MSSTGSSICGFCRKDLSLHVNPENKCKCGDYKKKNTKPLFIDIHNDIVEDVCNGEHVDSHWIKDAFELNGYSIVDNNNGSGLRNQILNQANTIRNQRTDNILLRKLLKETNQHIIELLEYSEVDKEVAHVWSNAEDQSYKVKQYLNN